MADQLTGNHADSRLSGSRFDNKYQIFILALPKHKL